MNIDKTRIENDSMGAVEIPSSALYGPQTQRALNNFNIHDEVLPWKFIAAVILIKKAAATTNEQLGLLETNKAQAIIKSCNALLTRKDESQFPVSVYQTGSGTSTNMNVNEVIATIAASEENTIHPNDHVNLAQSSNDVIPTAIHVSVAVEIEKILLPSIQNLIATIRAKGNEYADVIKTGRTHLMDALPIKVQAEFEAWAIQLEECKERLLENMHRLSRVALGGTAVGSGINCHADYPQLALSVISRETGLTFTPALSYYKALSSMDTPLEVSGNLKTLTSVLFKIANDLRWMNSGPLSGLAEVSLPSLQPGSSIMPAKVNPVIPEAVCMASAQVVGYDAAITIAAQSGNFQLNTMLPLIANNLLLSTELVSGSCNALAEKCIVSLTVNTEVCSEKLNQNPILVTALTSEIGYTRAAELAKIATREKRTILDVAKEHTEIPEDELYKLLDPKKMAGR